MANYINYVKNQIENQNPWYTSSQFTWAEKESIKRIYDQRRRFFYKIVINEILKKKRINLLDYGCGDGYWALFFSKIPHCKVVGVDYNSLRLKRAKTLIKNATFIEADLRKKNPELGKYDIVFCSQVIEHIKNDISFLKDIKNYLNKDGILILGTTNEGCLTQRFRNHFKKVGTDHVHFYVEKEIKTKIKKLDYEILHIYREVFYPGCDRLYYKLTSTNFGFKFLEILAQLFPSQCSDYYFKCKIL